MNILKVKNNFISVEYNLQTGFFSLFKEEEKVIENAYCKVNTEKEEYLSCKSEKIEGDISDGTLTIKNIFPSIENTLQFIIPDNENFILIKSKVKNISDKDVTILSITPFCIEDKIYPFKEIGKCHFYKNGYQSWSPAMSLPATSCDLLPREILPGTSLFKKIHLSQPHYKVIKKSGYLSSDGITIISCKENFLLLGFTTCFNFLSQIKLEVNDFGENKFKVYTISEMNNYILKSQKEISCEDLMIIFSGDKFSALEKFATATAESMKTKKWDKVPSGWCSWYYYFNKITEDEILKNIELIKKQKEELPFDYIQIDDGYQKDIGDWLTTNNKFPKGMEYIAKKIEDAGFIPGIWVAPFIVRPSSDVFKKHFDWILKDENGKPVLAGINPVWGGKYYALDLTHPGVEDFLKNIFETIVHKWGYKILKLDFIFAGTLPGIHFDRLATRVQAYRKGLNIIRNASGEDTFLLGCGAPIFPSLGLVNGMRISGDVDPSWVHWSEKIVGKEFTLGTINSVRNTITRYFMHNTFWVNDPDCLLVRDDKTSLTEEEVRTLTSVIALSGGMVVSSDNFITLSKHRAKYIKYCLPPVKGKIKPVDIFENSYPKYLFVDFEKNNIKWHLLCIINWENKKCDMEIELGKIGLDTSTKYCLYSFWKKDFLEITEDKIIVRNMQPHSCEVIRITAVQNIPQIVGSSFHISQGEEIEEYHFSSTLRQLYFKVNIPYIADGDIKILLPQDMIFEMLTTTSGEHSSKLENNILTIHAKINKEAIFTLNFKKE